MLHTLCHPLSVIQVQAIPDGTGGWKEISLPPVLLWASVKSLPPLQEASVGKERTARSPNPRRGRARYEIHLRDKPTLAPLREIYWGSKILTPLTDPRPAAARGYTVFQAVLLKEKKTP